MKFFNSKTSLFRSSNSDLLLLLCYFLFTCFFYIERTSFLDNPFTIFKLINDESLFVNASRYPAAVLQILPLLAIKFGVPLKLVLFVHSLSYFLFHAVIFCLIRYGLKDKVMSWLLLLTLTLPVAYTFFWNNNELFLGLTTLCLWLALMREGKLVGSIIVAIILAWIHPLLAVIVLFLMVLSVLTKDINKTTLLYNLLAYSISYFMKSKFFPNYYDTGKRELLMKNLTQFEISSGSFLDLLGSTSYWPIALCCIVVLGVLLYCRHWLYAVLLTGFYTCFLLLTELTEVDPSYVFYNEGNYRVLFFVAVYTLLVSRLYEKIGWIRIALAILIIIAFIRIGLSSTFYSDRITWYQEVARTHDRKVLSYGNQTKQKLIQSWASPFESMLLSTISGESKTTIFSDDPSSLAEEMKSNQQMITTHGKFLIYNPSNGYFRLADKNYSAGHIE